MATSCSPFAQPAFIATVIAAVPYFISVAWLYQKYVYHMTPREKEVVWAGLFYREQQHAEEEEEELPIKPSKYYFKIWTLTASLSALGFLGTWITMLLNVCDLTAHHADLASGNQYVFAVIVGVQTLYNISVGSNTTTITTKHTTASSNNNRIMIMRKATGHHRLSAIINGSPALLILWMALVLWAAVLSYIWMWKVAWDIVFASDSGATAQSHDWQSWALHFLNTCLIFHGIWWDALFWWYTWSRELTKEARCSQLMRIANTATQAVFLPLVSEPDASLSTATTTTTTSNNNTDATILIHTISAPSSLFKYSYTVQDYTNTYLDLARPKKSNCYFDSLGYYPYFPYLFESQKI